MQCSRQVVKLIDDAIASEAEDTGGWNGVESVGTCAEEC